MTRPAQSNAVITFDSLSLIHPFQDTRKDTPKVDVRIMLNDTVLKYGENLVLTISLTNKEHLYQKLLFDKPSFITGGPWSTKGKVIDTRTNKSVVLYENKAMLASQIFNESDVKDDYYILQPGQTISARYDLKDIVVLEAPKNLLPAGSYEVQLFYFDNPSNILTIVIQ